MLKPQRIMIIPLMILLVILLTSCNEGKNKNLPQNARPAGSESTKKESTQPKNMPEEVLYVCEFTRNQVSVIDLVTGQTVKEIPVGAKPVALIKSPDNRYVYVANSGSGDIYSINTKTGEIEAKISIGNQPVAMTLNSTGTKLYALDYFFNRVSVVDLKLRSMIGFYELNTRGFQDRIEPPDCCSDFFGEPMGAGRKPSAVVLDEAAGKLYVGNMGTWDVAVISLEEEKEVNAYDATFGINEMLLIEEENILYISAAGNEIDINDFILKLDLKGGGTVEKIAVGKKPVDLALSPDRQILYVLTQDDAKLTALSRKNGKIIAQCFLNGKPGALILADGGSTAFIADPLKGTVQIVDTKTFSVIKEFEAGVTPKSLVYVKQ
jgi:YVTN family beta-propeller protein